MREALLHPFRSLRKLRIRELQVGSAASGVFLLVFSVAYAKPNEFVRAPLAPLRPGEQPKVNVVNYIEQLTIVPFWTVVFAIGFGVLLAAAVRDTYGPKAHLFAGVVMAMYSAASFATAFSNPGTYIITATFAAAFSFAQFTLMSTYVHRHERISLLIRQSEAERQEYRLLKEEGDK